MRLPHELESEEYWRHFNWVMQYPAGRRGLYTQPMFEVVGQHPCERDARDEDCRCLLS